VTDAPHFADARILVVDDQAPNVMLLERLLERWQYRNVMGTTDSGEVLELCERVRPDLVLLDLQMPAPDGYEVMRQLEPWTRGAARLPICVLTADVTPEARRRALSMGARDFLTKPFDHDEVRLRVANLLEIRRAQLDLQEQNLTLDQRVRSRTRDLERAREETLERLALAGEYRDDDTGEHAQRVGRTVAELAARLGLPAAEVAVLHRAALLHDIGKIGIADTILLKPGRLTDDEFTLMQTHTLVGADILGGTSSDVLEVSAVIARTHHEHWDGTGYPDGLDRDEIPLPGRLTAVADVFDALTHDRPYKEAWPLDAAVAEMGRLSGTHFDPAVIEVFLALDHEALLARVGDDGLPSG